MGAAQIAQPLEAFIQERVKLCNICNSYLSDLFLAPRLLVLLRVPIKQMQLLKLGILTGMQRVRPFLGIKGSSVGGTVPAGKGTGKFRSVPGQCLAPAVGTGCFVPQGSSGRDAVTCEEKG